MKDMALYIRYMAYKYAFQRKICKYFSFLNKINNDWCYIFVYKQNVFYLTFSRKE